MKRHSAPPPPRRPGCSPWVPPASSNRRASSIRNISCAWPATRSRRTCITGRSCWRPRRALRSWRSIVTAHARPRPPDWHIAPKPGTDGALAMGIIAAMMRGDHVDEDCARAYTVDHDALSERALDFTPDYVEKVIGVPAEDRDAVRARVRDRAALRDPYGRGGRHARLLAQPQSL